MSIQVVPPPACLRLHPNQQRGHKPTHAYSDMWRRPTRHVVPSKGPLRGAELDAGGAHAAACEGGEIPADALHQLQPSQVLRAHINKMCVG